MGVEWDFGLGLSILPPQPAIPAFGDTSQETQDWAGNPGFSRNYAPDGPRNEAAETKGHQLKKHRLFNRVTRGAVRRP
jgi:hypothetical protein